MYNTPMTLKDLYTLIKSRKEQMPPGSYVASLFTEGENRIIQKVGEEAVEVVIAAKNNDTKELTSESADLLFHLMVLLVEKGVSLEDIEAELSRRHAK